ncbi:MAG: DMT family transporter [Thermoleophilia bacterium]|nr:DMT family transporter [Thermoleophilia bacterium]
MLSAGFALAASLAWGLGDFFGGLKSRALPALAVMAWSQPFGLVALGIAVAVRGSGPADAGVAWACVSAVLGTIGLAAFYRGMAAGAMSVVAPIAAVAAGIPVAWGIAAGDRIDGLQGIGFVAALGGSLLASVERRDERARVARGVGWAVAAMLAFGAYYAPMHAAAAHDWLWPAFLFRCTSVSLVWTTALLRGGGHGVAREHLPGLVAIGVLDTGGNALFAAAASTHGLLSVVSVLASLYPVVTVLLARLVLGERVQRSQEAGMLVTLAGVVLITAG